MITVELNLLCEQKGDCTGQCVASEPLPTLEAALKSAVSRAWEKGWQIEPVLDRETGSAAIGIRAYCPNCLKSES